jgi:lipid II:glycine glycyltransferase (peptidoglycan interpeptide bridge formation enzyme)
MLSLQELRSIDDTDWDDIVVASSRGILFHMSGWLNAVRDAQGLELVRLGIHRDGSLVGVFPIFLKSYGPLTVLASPLVIEDTHYLGPVVDDNLLPEVIREFQQYAASRSMMSYTRIVMPHCQPREPFAKLGYECIDNLTHVVDLALGSADLWQRVKPPCRRQIKKAERAGVVTKIVTDDSQIESYYALVEELYHRQKRTPPSPAGFFRQVWDRFGPSGNLVWVFAWHEEKLAAGALLGVWKGTVYFIDGASSHALQHLGASNALHWAAIQWAQAQGNRYYDFVGSNIPRFAQFKGSFGGDLVRYLTLEQARPRFIRSLRVKYSAYKAFINRIKVLRHS